MAITGYPYLLSGAIGVEEWVSTIGSAEELQTDLDLHRQAAVRP